MSAHLFKDGQILVPCGQIWYLDLRRVFCNRSSSLLVAFAALGTFAGRGSVCF